MTKGTIKIDNKTLHFKTVILYDGHYGDVIVTRFWEKNSVIFARRTCFGKKQKLIVPDILFQIDEDAGNPLIVASRWRFLIGKELDKIERVNEVKNNKLI